MILLIWFSSKVHKCLRSTVLKHAEMQSETQGVQDFGAESGASVAKNSSEDSAV